MNEQPKCPVLRMLVSITDLDRGKRVSALLLKAGVHMHYQLRGEGTATSELLDTLGLESTPKLVTVSLVTMPMLTKLMYKLEKVLLSEEAGGGIAFALPISGASMPILRALSGQPQSDCKLEMEREVMNVTQNSGYSLVLAIVNQGFNEEVMDAAKGAGATGGTIIRAHRQDSDLSKFMGICIQPEKEMIVILSPKDKKHQIMKAISVQCGVKSEAKGLVISMPVDEVAGISWDDDAPENLA